MLMRHAKSDWASGALSDFERPLNERGERAAAAMAKVIAKLPEPPELIVSSPAVRARLTAEAVAEELDEVGLELKDDLYGATAGQLLQAVRALDPQFQRVLLVGHNPGMSELAGQLSGDAAVELRTADLALFECDGDWEQASPQTFTLRELIRARESSSG
jgi:phosphohistidine phosphatase